MCGIAGLIYKDRAVKDNEIKKMTDQMIHRGPDAEGFYIDDRVGFGHRRLSIIDLEGGKQPFISECNNYVITFNGEIYNYKELQKELSNNFTIKTNSDTEVILYSYIKWGNQCLDRLRGMFAFAIYDKKNEIIFAARDRVGIKPFYFSYNKEFFTFSSEINPILENYDKLEVSDLALQHYLKFGYTPANQSIFKEINKLQPAHFLVFDLKTFSLNINKYWSVKIKESESISEDEAYILLNNKLNESVKMHLVSDVPFGSFLSGGVDSGLLTGIMTSLMKEKVKSFTIGYDEKEISEAQDAENAANILKTEHNCETVKPAFDADFFSKLLWHFGEPFSDSSMIPTYFVSKAASKKVKMVLSGDGGDELFAGYKIYSELDNELLYKPIMSLKRSVANLIEMIKPNECFRWKYHSYNFNKKYDYYYSIFQNSELLELLNTEVNEFVSCKNAKVNSVTEALYNDFTNYMVDDVLTKVDRMSMACSIEVRVPLLDHHVVELAFSLPLEMKLKKIKPLNHDKKFILKKIAENYLPKKHLNKVKRGFAVPLHQWLENDYRDLILKELSEKNNPIFKYLNYSYVYDLIDRKSTLSPIFSPKIWNLFVLSLWFKIYQEKVL